MDAKTADSTHRTFLATSSAIWNREQKRQCADRSESPHPAPAPGPCIRASPEPCRARWCQKSFQGINTMVLESLGPRELNLSQTLVVLTSTFRCCPYRAR